MAVPRPLLDLTVAEWLDELARPRPAPGGGSALAFALASASAVLAMAARVSESGGLAAQADALRARTTMLAQLDADAYESALGSRETNEGLRADRRDWEIGQAFARAAEPPLEIARAASDVAELAALLAQDGDPRAGSGVCFRAGDERTDLGTGLRQLLSRQDPPQRGRWEKP